MKLFSAFFIVCFCAACSSGNEIPEDVLGINKMKIVMWDMIRAGELANNGYWEKDSSNSSIKTLPTVKDDAKYEAFQQVFSIHKITKDQFYKSYKYYEEHPDKNKILMDSLTAYANNRRKDLFVKPEP